MVENKGWTNKTSVKNEHGKFILIKYEFNSKHSLGSPFKKQIKKEYSSSGTLLSMNIDNFWKDISIEYYPNGEIRQKWKCKKIFGIAINKSITKEYLENGAIQAKTKDKCWTTIVHSSW